MTLVVVGANYRSVGFDALGAVAFNPDRYAEAYGRLLNLDGVREAAILSTCNRSEIYAVVDQREKGLLTLQRFFTEFHQLREHDGKLRLTKLTSTRAVRHLFRVVCGLDSYLLGETQIAGQVKDAYRVALRHNGPGPLLNRLFHKAFHVNKRVRSETKLQRGATSLSEVCVELAKKVFFPFDQRSALVLGAGQTAELVAKTLVRSRIGSLVIANRTLTRAEALADELGARAIPLNGVSAVLHEFDIVVGATSSPEPLLDEKIVRAALARRQGRPMVFLDLAIPPDVHTTVADLQGAYLYGLADLRRIVEENRNSKLVQVVSAERIVDQEVRDYFDWLKHAEIGPTIQELRAKIEAIRLAELKKFEPKLREEDRELVNWLTSRIVNKVLHLPMVRLREVAASEDGWYKVETLRDLFGLTGGQPGE